jgi:MFS family permease
MSDTQDAEAGVKRDPYSALRVRDFRLLMLGAFVASFGQQMLTVALGWELYNRTNSALALGGVGLAQVLPIILLSLPAGHVVDRFSRKRVIVVAQTIMAVAAFGLAVISAEHGSLALVYGCLVLIGGAVAFGNPAGSALIAQVIPPPLFENATTWRSSSGQLSSVIGPAVGGFLLGILPGAAAIYVLAGLGALVYVVMLLQARVRYPQARGNTVNALESLAEGLRFLRQTQVMLAAITLDLFAVLLGGATTLLPVFARDILHVGPVGLGWLQAADSLGAVCMALVLAHRPPFARAGRALLAAVAVFGMATVVFGISHSFALSFLMLFVLGACDNISVVIRSTLVLVRTPDSMRGRIGALNSLFINTSNQLGGFESGFTAQLFGPVAAVAAGGIGTLLVVLLVAWRWPEMRRLTTLREH